MQFLLKFQLRMYTLKRQSKPIHVPKIWTKLAILSCGTSMDLSLRGKSIDVSHDNISEMYNKIAYNVGFEFLAEMLRTYRVLRKFVPIF